MEAQAPAPPPGPFWQEKLDIGQALGVGGVFSLQGSQPTSSQERFPTSTSSSPNSDLGRQLRPGACSRRFPGLAASLRPAQPQEPSQCRGRVRGPHHPTHPGCIARSSLQTRLRPACTHCREHPGSREGQQAARPAQGLISRGY